MTDPRTPEIIAWPDTLPLTERLVTLHAMTIAFPPLQRRQCTYASEVQAHALHARGLAEEVAKVYLDDHSKK
jgi:hypothetical protein